MKSEQPTVSSAERKSSKQKRKRIIAYVVTAVVILALSLALCLQWKKIITGRIYTAIELKPNTKGYETWLHPPTIITRGYHLFNVTNPIDIVTNPRSAKVMVQETRPYHYSLASTKQDVHWSSDNKALHYSIHRLFTRHPTRFDPSSVNDTGVFVDLLRATFRTQFQATAASSFYDLSGLHTFYHRNAVEQLEGFTTDLFKLLQDKMTGPNTAKSGFIYRYNGSRSYNYTIKSGLMEKGQVLDFASENVPFSFSTADRYNFPIYDGLTFVPNLFNKKSMNIFQADFCRPLHVKFNRVLSMFGGIDVHEYVITLIDLHECNDPNNIATCPELEMLDVSKCISATLPDNTVFLSKPHFYGANDNVTRKMNIEGFTPSRDKHEALIYFEPYSGTPLRAHHRIQLNIDAMIDPMKQSRDESELKPARGRAVKRVVPLVWIDQEVNVNEATLRIFRFVHIALRYGQIAILVVAIVLVILIVLVVEFIARRKAKNHRAKLVGNSKSDELLKK